jgi:phosphoribosyl 1,2-cyclic phosphate phosphodiesterase
MKITVLGCGGSGGVPFADGTPGGNWGDCDPANPRNRRRRVSVLVEQGGTVLLIDATPDLRLQLLDSGCPRIDAVLFTHAHADHCHGLDELRAMAHACGGPIDAYMDSATRELLVRRFGYALTSSHDPNGFYSPILNDIAIEGPVEIGGLRILPFIQEHGRDTSLGYRIGDFAYSTDVTALDAAAFSVLEGIELWILDCLRERPHPTHSHLAQSLEWIARVGPARALLTHMNHQIDYDDLKSRCPPGVEPAYDGMVLELPSRVR